MIAGSLADRDGRIQKGDRVLSINGRSTKGVSHGEALKILKVIEGVKYFHKHGIWPGPTLLSEPTAPFQDSHLLNGHSFPCHLSKPLPS